jgi:hypothetical protein
MFYSVGSRAGVLLILTPVSKQQFVFLSMATSQTCSATVIASSRQRIKKKAQENLCADRKLQTD